MQLLQRKMQSDFEGQRGNERTQYFQLVRYDAQETIPEEKMDCGERRK